MKTTDVIINEVIDDVRYTMRSAKDPRQRVLYLRSRLRVRLPHVYMIHIQYGWVKQNLKPYEVIKRDNYYVIGCGYVVTPVKQQITLHLVWVPDEYRDMI